MAQQIQKPKTEQEKKVDQAEAQALAEADAVRQEEIRSQAEETISDIDALLDEIDELLEANAEDFVKAYQQKGGQATVLGSGMKRLLEWANGIRDQVVPRLPSVTPAV